MVESARTLGGIRVTPERTGKKGIITAAQRIAGKIGEKLSVESAIDVVKNPFSEIDYFLENWISSVDGYGKLNERQDPVSFYLCEQLVNARRVLRDIGKKTRTSNVQPISSFDLFEGTKEDLDKVMQVFHAKRGKSNGSSFKKPLEEAPNVPGIFSVGLVQKLETISDIGTSLSGVKLERVNYGIGNGIYGILRIIVDN